MTHTQTHDRAAAKDRLRAEALARRRSLPAEAGLEFARRLAAEGVRLAAIWRPGAVSAFHPISGEPDTLPLLSALTAAGFATALPVTVSRTAPLTFRQWTPGDPTAPGAMRIPEPTAIAAEIQPELLFVPLAAFDRRGHRIGFGAGHYDRTLAGLRAKGPVHAVGVAFSVSEIDRVPNEAHDEPLDLILTEKELIVPQFANR